MSTTTVSNASPVTAITPSVDEKTTDWLIRTATENASSPEEAYRLLVEVTWERATQKKFKKNSFEAVTEFSTGQQELLERIQFVREVASNTLRKLTYDTVPSEWAWAQYRSGSITITGVFRHDSTWGGRDVNITADIASGAKTLNKSDFIKFTVNNGSRTIEGQVAVNLLNNDPIAISQLVRSSSKRQARTTLTSERKSLQDEKKELEAKLAKMAEKEAALDKKSERLNK